ncbi:hypothetical protein [Thermovibrio sp.]
MKVAQRTAFIPYPELFTCLDRFCPTWGAPVSVKKVGGTEVLACTDSRCPYYEPLEREEV